MNFFTGDFNKVGAPIIYVECEGSKTSDPEQLPIHEIRASAR
ncbi:hypothetical protein PAMC26510_37725 [Caballeronia sordidicola]|uniref:Uncharacterized protein n=1 Tax=Caballeronia sordidicola TaxID=196367 RepID=A0A226X0Q4_CABSO|nr:hypothetical protein PAMC26510_37725 [Caballeronia sordidicola]OXC76607.1 hypothetical protein BSU04_21560 [Caballeronia sordidicola]